MPGSQNSGLGYECNLVSELFFFTGNPMNPSRKHLLKRKRHGELIHTLNLAQRKRIFSHSPKGMLTRYRGESDNFNKCRRLSFSRIVCVHSHTLICVGGGEAIYSNIRVRKTKLKLKKQDTTRLPIRTRIRHSSFLI